MRPDKNHELNIRYQDAGRRIELNAKGIQVVLMLIALVGSLILIFRW